MYLITKGTWVKIQNILLEPERRSSQLPEDSKKVPYIMKVKGYMLSDAGLNDFVEVETVSGRKVKGILIESNPGYHHGYGPPVDELLHIGEKEKKLLDNHN